MRSLEDEISEIAGVVAASVNPVDDGPVGVRISVRDGTDRARVARAVQDALRRRGLSSIMASLGPDSAPVDHDPADRPEGEHREDDHQENEHQKDEHQKDEHQKDEHREDRPGSTPAVPHPSRDTADGAVPAHGRIERSEGSTPGPIREGGSVESPPIGPEGGSTAVEAPPRPPSPSVSNNVTRAAVSESAGGIEVAVRLGDGRRASCRAGSSNEALHRAIVEAVYQADGRQGTIPLVRSVEIQRRGEKSSATVLLERDGQVLIGSAMVGATEVLAVARAAWVALHFG